MVRLADFVPAGQKLPRKEELLRLLKPLREHETKLGLELGVPLAGEDERGVADILEQVAPQIQSPAQWERVVGPYVVRPLQDWLARTKERLALDMRWEAWQLDFIPLVNTALQEIARFVSAREQQVSEDVRERLYEAGYPRTDEPLSRMALNVLRGLPGLDCVLVGMRRREYVEDAMGTTELPQVDGLSILERFTALVGPVVLR
jgi:hypothetical protein